MRGSRPKSARVSPHIWLKLFQISSDNSTVITGYKTNVWLWLLMLCMSILGLIVCHSCLCCTFKFFKYFCLLFLTFLSLLFWRINVFITWPHHLLLWIQQQQRSQVLLISLSQHNNTEDVTRQTFHLGLLSNVRFTGYRMKREEHDMTRHLQSHIITANVVIDIKIFIIYTLV